LLREGRAREGRLKRMIQDDEEKYKKWRNRHLRQDKRNNVTKNSHIRREDYYFTDDHEVKQVVF
jgi:hypothetical protein